MAKRPYQFVVHPEEGHLAGLVKEVGEGNEGVGLFQVEDQHSCYEGHALDLRSKVKRLGYSMSGHSYY